MPRPNLFVEIAVMVEKFGWTAKEMHWRIIEKKALNKMIVVIVRLIAI